MNPIEVNLSELSNAEAVDFGKVFYLPPKLPDMRLIVLKKGDYYQAICIDIEIDAVGKTLKEACENLRQKLKRYIKQMVDNYNGDEKAAFNDIVQVAFTDDSMKALLFNRYLSAKRQYTMDKIAKENKAKSRGEEILILLRTCLRFRRTQIQFSLKLAAGIA